MVICFGLNNDKNLNESISSNNHNQFKDIEKKDYTGIHICYDNNIDINNGIFSYSNLVKKDWDNVLYKFNFI